MNYSFIVFEYNLNDEEYKDEMFYTDIIEHSEFILKFSTNFFKKNSVNILLSSETINTVRDAMDYKVCCFIKNSLNLNKSSFYIEESQNKNLEAISEMNIHSKIFLENFLKKMKWEGEIVVFGHDLDPFYIIKIK